MSSILWLSFFAIIVCCRCESFTYKYYPTYHLGPLINMTSRNGWMNDPNGFSIYNGEYHLFYQYNPNTSLDAGIAHWGHAKSKDLVYWQNLPIALYPDKSYDIDGVFSGSVLVENETMFIYYTGNVNHPDQTPDHENRQNLATSSDAKTFVKYDKNPIIEGDEHQPNFRDPKVWKNNDKYYMVIGNSFDNGTRGRALLYTSTDKLNWQQASVLAESYGSLGYMWECPDFFELDGYYVLIISPQGIEPQGDNYNNLYSNGYIIGFFDNTSCLFTQVHAYKELDHGHDFYAGQTILDKHGDRVIVAWMDMWEQNYPEGPDGFTGQMTLPRRLRLNEYGYLLQQPVREIQRAVGRRLHSGRGRCGTTVTFTNHAGRVEISAYKRKDFTLYIETKGGNDTVKISYSYVQGYVQLDRGGKDGVRRTTYRPLTDKLYLLIFIDYSSLDVFIGKKGDVTFSSRFFPEDAPLIVRIADDSEAYMFNVNDMKRTVPRPLSQPRI